MLPSRGVLRSLPSARATSSISSQSISRSSRRLGDGRHFGTSLRSSGSGAPWTSLRTANSRLGGLAGSVALGGSLQTRRAISIWGNSKPEQPAPQAPAAASSQPPADLAASNAADAAASSSGSVPTPPPAVDAAASSSSASIPTPPPAAEPITTFSDVAPSTTIPELDGASLLDLPEQIGYLRTLGLDFGWGPSSVMQWVFEHIHVYTGLPWWGSIAATAILLRVVMFKPLLKSQETSARMQQLQRDPRYDEARTQMQEAMSRGDSAMMAEARRDLSLLNKAAGVNPANGLWGLIQIPFGYGMFRVLNGASSIPVPGMETGGFLWLTDLTAPDPMYLLPLLGPISMFVMVKLGSKYATPQGKAQQRLMIYILGPLTVIFTAYLPGAVQWYFFITGLMGVFQNWFMNLPSVRHRLGLPSIVPHHHLGSMPTTARTLGGAMYQPPRSTQPAPGSSQDGSISGIMGGFKQTVHQAKGGAGNYMEAARQREEAKAEKQYTEKRTEQDREKFWGNVRRK